MKKLLVTCCFVAIPLLLSPLQARIGESIRQIEMRLGSTGLSVKPEWPDNIYPKRLQKHPLRDVLDYLSYNPDFEVHCYFKKFDTNKDRGNEKLRQKDKDINNLKNIPGWDYWVYTYKGVSVMEVFVRVGTRMTDAEVNQILAFNQGDSNWKKVNKDEEEDSTTDDEDVAEEESSEVDIEAFESSLIGYNLVRQDGAVYARKFGQNSLVLFRKEVEGLIAEQMNKGSNTSTVGF